MWEAENFVEYELKFLEAGTTGPIQGLSIVTNLVPFFSGDTFSLIRFRDQKKTLKKYFLSRYKYNNCLDKINTVCLSLVPFDIVIYLCILSESAKNKVFFVVVLMKIDKF